MVMIFQLMVFFPNQRDLICVLVVIFILLGNHVQCKSYNNYLLYEPLVEKRNEKINMI